MPYRPHTPHGFHAHAHSMHFNSAPHSHPFLLCTDLGWVNFEWLAPSNTIVPLQLTAIRSLWFSNCWPTQQFLPVFNVSTQQPNKHWTRRYHMQGKYSISEAHRRITFTGALLQRMSEADGDMVPYCDWMWQGDSPQATYDRVRDSNQCQDFTYIRCDHEGNVIEINFGVRGLSGAFHIYSYPTRVYASGAFESRV